MKNNIPFNIADLLALVLGVERKVLLTQRTPYISEMNGSNEKICTDLGQNYLSNVVPVT